MKKTNYSNMSAIAVNKSLLKEYQTSYGRTVYLDKDSEFQIKLFNPTTETVAAEVFVNEKSLGEKIIIRPGQLIWLERYLDEAKKFRFDTYEVDASIEEVKQAIRNNGDIKVKFYKEKHYQNSWHDLLGNYPYNLGRKVDSKQCYEIPFMIWCSDKYKENHADIVKSIQKSVDKPLMSDNLCHLLMRLGGVKSVYYHESRDVLSPQYNCPPRKYY